MSSRHKEVAFENPFAQRGSSQSSLLIEYFEADKKDTGVPELEAIKQAKRDALSETPEGTLGRNEARVLDQTYFCILTML